MNAAVKLLNPVKIPPQSLDLERYILGSMMIDRQAVSEALSLIQPDYFYLPFHKEVFEAISEMFRSNTPVDLLTVSKRLKGIEPYKITELAEEVASTANVQEYCLIVAEKFIRREIIRASHELNKSAYDEVIDPLELLSTTTGELIKVMGELGRGSDIPFYKILKKIQSEAEEIFRTGKPNGIPYGLYPLDRLTGGMYPSDLIIIAARPGMGKSALMMTIAAALARNDVHTGIISMEMSMQELGQRVISMESGISGEKFRKGGISESELSAINSKIDQIQHYGIHISDRSSQNVVEVKAKAMEWQRKYNIKALFVDYLGQMSPLDKKQSREQQVSSFSSGLKATAKDLNIPVIALCQLSRNVENRGDKRPILADLKDSGGIEADADAVLFLYRPEYYGIKEGMDGGILDEGLTEIELAKYRHGKPGVVELIFTGAKFREKEIWVNNRTEPIKEEMPF